MISFKDKIQILRSLKTDDLDLTEVSKYLNLLKHKSLAGSVLDNLLDSLTDIDSQMTAVYGSVSDEDWLDLVSDYETPIENETKENSSYVFVRNNFKTFVGAYKALDSIISDLDLNVLFNSLSKVLYCRTSSLQFIFFNVARYKLNAVLYFLLEGVKSNPSVYIPYFVSFVSRINLDCTKAIKQYIEIVRRMTNKKDKINNSKVDNKSNYSKIDKLDNRSKNLLYIQATQGLIYICCFKREIIDDCRDILDYVFREDICSFMNSNVVEVFCSLSGYKCKLFKSLENHVLYLFPFDKSIIKPIHEMYEDLYVEFE